MRVAHINIYLQLRVVCVIQRTYTYFCERVCDVTDAVLARCDRSKIEYSLLDRALALKKQEIDHDRGF